MHRTQTPVSPDKFALEVVVPCFNEAQRLQGEVFLRFLEHHTDLRFLFVDDGSTDHTWSILENLQKSSNQILCIALEENCGKAEAIRQGVLYLERETNSPLLGFIDADLAIPLEQIMVLQQALKTTDHTLAISSRSLRPEQMEVQEKTDPLRGFGSKAFKYFVRYFFNLNISDTQCGCKLFKRKLVPTMFREKFLSRWLFDVEFFMRLRTAGKLSVAEVQLKKLNSNLESKMKWSEAFSIFRDAVKILLKYRNF